MRGICIFNIELICVNDVDFFSKFGCIIKIFGKRNVLSCVMNLVMNFMFLFFLGYKRIILRIVLFEIYCVRVFKCFLSFVFIWLIYDFVLYFIYVFGIWELLCI